MVITAHIKCKLSSSHVYTVRAKCSNRNGLQHLEPPLSGRDGGDEARGHNLWHVRPERPLTAVREKQGTHITWEADGDHNNNNNNNNNNGKNTQVMIGLVITTLLLAAQLMII